MEADCGSAGDRTKAMGRSMVVERVAPRRVEVSRVLIAANRRKDEQTEAAAQAETAPGKRWGHKTDAVGVSCMRERVLLISGSQTARV